MPIQLSDEAVSKLIEQTLSPSTYVASQPSGSKVKILILQRAWIVVGEYHKEGQEHVLEKASVLRVWGTTKGIGEVALGGPLSNTKLDPCGTVRAHELATVMVVECDDSKWSL